MSTYFVCVYIGNGSLHTGEPKRKKESAEKEMFGTFRKVQIIEMILSDDDYKELVGA